MKKLIKLVYVNVLFCLFPVNLTGQNWFPLELGNEWQYIQIEHYQNLATNDTTAFYVELITNKILKDTIILNITYYQRSLEPDLWYRYSITEQKIFIWNNIDDRLIMDFTLPADSFFISYLPDYGEILAQVIEGSSVLFDSTYPYKGYEWFLLADFYERNKFVENYGLANYYFNWVDNGLMLNYRKYRNLVQANINLVNYSADVDPEIFLTPLTILWDSTFSLSVTIKHIYNLLVQNSSYPYIGLNFIDSVHMHSFYSRGDSIVNNDPIICINIQNSEEWIINTTLNFNLLSDDFVFNYRFEAIDKGLVPHRSFAPDSGYFIAVYDSTSGVNEIGKLPWLFNVSQNYPNPFNPSTTIRYEIQERGFVTLKVYDILGNEIVTLVNEEKPAGSYEIDFNIYSNEGQNLVSGVYFYQLKAGRFIQTKKMILLR
ncbi:MAG: T9SS type A sorting domain-containing protein [Ignavibacteriaceae bacterium]